MSTFFVMGGGGFAMEPDNLLLDKYILSLSETNKPRVAFIGTASGDSERYINNFYTAYKTLNCDPSHLSLFKPHTRDLEAYIFEQDIIHVGGGNTLNLLCLWKQWGLDKMLEKSYKKGIIMTGISAGMICWFEEGVTDSFGVSLEKLDCLGFLRGSACPHFDGEEERKPKYIELLENNIIKPGIALDDGAGVLYKDNEIVKCVSSRKNAKAYFFQKEDHQILQKNLEIQFLGKCI